MRKIFLVLSTFIITMLATTMVAFAASGTLQEDADGIWRYYNNGVFDDTKSGMVEYDGGLFIVIDGVLRRDFNGLCHVLLPGVDKWYFFSNGQVHNGTSGFVMYDNEWFYLDKGELDSTKTGIYWYNNRRFLVAEGRLVSEYQGLYHNTTGPEADDKWYYFADGQLQDWYCGLATYDGEWFLLEYGYIQEEYTGFFEYDNETFYLINGMVTDKEPEPLPPGDWICYAGGCMSSSNIHTYIKVYQEQNTWEKRKVYTSGMHNWVTGPVSAHGGSDGIVSYYGTYICSVCGYDSCIIDSSTISPATP